MNPTPLAYFLHSFSPAAHETLVLDWVFAGICLAVCILVAGLLLIAVLRRRAPGPGLVTGGNGLRWVAIGTGASTAILLGMTIYALLVLEHVATPPRQPDLAITVTGYDWWWRIMYDDPDPAKRFETANEIHIPVGMPVRVNLESADVIHAFWAPLLAGKMQMIPGLTNRTWIAADRPGVYRGQCTQYCGAQHAHMAFEVVAQSPADFAAWRAAQIKPAVAASTRGQAIFLANCAGCHAVRGSGGEGGHAPDLTHLASRRMIAAGLLTNTPAHVMDWIAHVQDLKPGARMPPFVFSADDQAALSTYLQGLQ